MRRITSEERRLFETLHNNRLEANKVFNQRAFRGIKPNVVDKYAETAHFVYELLQNADDANATEVTIILKKDSLFFKHNGTKHFDITAEDDECVGDINSITGIGNSSKENTQKIGKFGVGFKAVFQYTDTPEIFDEPFKFKIEDLIVPTLIEYDYPERNPGETLFVLPFRNPEKAFNEIKKRLEVLKNPVLFLRNLKKIIWKIDSDKEQKIETEYSKTLLERKTLDNITLEKYLLNNASKTDCIFLFSRDIKITMKGDIESIFPIYVGFYYDENKKTLITDNIHEIYCFFPTKETFKTCFITHAPFLLTENRQNIKQDESVNVDLLELLSELATDAVIALRDYGKGNGTLLINENIVDIIPQYSSKYFSDNSFVEKPMLKAFREMLKYEPILLSRNNRYLMIEEAYKTTGAVIEILSKEQFYFLKSNKWTNRVFENIDFLKWELILKLNKLDDYERLYVGIKEFTIENFGKEITSAFMDMQEKEWVTKFYTFLREHASKYWDFSQPQNRATAYVFRHAPIIKIQSGEWIQPFVDIETPNVFLPIDNTTSNSVEYNFIDKEYLEEDMACKFFNVIDIKQPNEKDYIRNIILKKYDGTVNEIIEIDDDVLASDFYLLLSYYGKIVNTNEEDEYIELLRGSLLLAGIDDVLHNPKDLYVKSDILSKYLSEDTLYFDTLFYKYALKEFKEQFVNEFIVKLGVKTEPIISNHRIYYDLLSPHFKKILESLSYYWFEYVDDYKCHSFTDAYNEGRLTKEISVYLWNEFLPNNKKTFTAKICTRGYRKHNSDFTDENSTFFYELKTFEWVYDKNGNAKKVSDIFVEDLADEYNLYNGLIERLGIEKRTQDLQKKYGVTEEEQEKFELGSIFKDLIGEDLSKEDALNLLREKKEKNKRERERQEANQQNTQAQSDVEPEKVEEPQDINKKLQKKWDEKKNRPVNKPHSSTHQSEELAFDNSPGIQSSGNNLPFFVEPSTAPIEEDIDNVIDTAKAEQKLKSKDTIAQEQAVIAKEQVDILELLNETPCYTFKWFKVLMELMHAGKQEFTQRTTQIDFSRYEMICSDKILHLTEPTLPVPSWICDAEKVSIVALTGTTSAKLDGLIIKTSDNSIDVSVELNDKTLNDLKQAKKIRISAVDNTNIIDSLETRFLQLDKEDDFDMNENLPQNLSFIYGPPGTGKTTELVRQVRELLTNEPNAKILVLTPTNKAADVVAIKMANDDVCYDGLARYGATESLYLIEDIGCVTNRDTTDLKGWHNIVVATAARYAYDFVQPDDTAICDYPWDYIFIDEASMIDILTITYILYKGANSKRIIISGDPKQIQPVVQNDMPAINIYNMVGLQGFADALFKYTRYPVQGLMTQHRSVPLIGQAVSNFSYDGLVDSDANRAPMKPLNLDGIDIKNVNFIGFDVVELDDIMGLNSIANSAFNLYSVIFTYNMIEYTIKQIEKNHPNKEYSIGVVCAYKAQSDAIKNMLENRPLSTDFCSVSCGTIHSFQGDECDIMFIVLNPPAICTKGTHVNNENIINVAMSRARDYLFFILPSGHQKGFYMKNKIGSVVPYTDRTIYNSHDIETVMFGGNNNFICENTHVTCHMPVNVYCEVSAIYEVRMSNEALDIKINL